MRKKERLFTLLALSAFLGAIGFHYRFGEWGFYRKIDTPEADLRMQVVQTAQGWLGYNEAEGSHEVIIDLYNSHEPLAMDYVVQYTDSWCAAFVSAVSIQCGVTDILPTECGCERQIGLFQALDAWEENDHAVPQPGDLIYYDWDMTKSGECTGWSDHVGIVVGTKWPFVKVIEGNKDDAVSYRVILLGDKTIRGYGRPDYASMSKNTP